MNEDNTSLLVVIEIAVLEQKHNLGVLDFYVVVIGLDVVVDKLVRLLAYYDKRQRNIQR